MKTTVNQLYPDIWLQLFEYFNANELFFSLMNVTKAADEVLFNFKHRFRLRGLVIDTHIRTLPKKCLLDQLVSLELHQGSSTDTTIEQCSELRALKLVGQSEWVISLLNNVAHNIIRLEQLVIAVPGVGSLYDLLASITSLTSLHRLEIHADELEEKLKICSSLLTETKIEQFVLHSCSLITWNDLSYMLPGLANICFLDLTLFPYNENSFYSFAFLKLCRISLILVDVSFKQIIQLVMTTPSLTKLKLSGIVGSEGFVINHKWFELFESCSSLLTIIVNVSLEQAINCFYSPMFEIALREINLSIKCTDDNCEYYLGEGDSYRWWNLSGIITRQQRKVAQT